MVQGIAEPGHRRRWLAALGLALIVAASHLALVARFGSDQPFHDQWGAEGFMLYRPWLHGVLTPEYFFFPHSEHRPAATRLLAWAEFALNGQWDARVQLLANAAIVAGFAGALGSAGWRSVSERWRPAVAVFAAVWFSLPCYWENTLWGFQSQFYFLLLFGFLHIAGTCAGQRPGWRWVFGQLAGLAALFSIAAGVASSAALLGLALTEWRRGRRDAWTVATAVTNAALVGLALWLLPPAAAAPAAHAGSVVTFTQSLTLLLAWPVRSAWGVVLALPWLVLAAHAIRRRLDQRGDRLLVALGAWGWAMLAILAFGRGEVPGRIAIRYFDVIAVLVFVNAIAVIRLRAAAGRRSGWWAVAAGSWAVVVAVGAAAANRPDGLQAGWTRFRGFFDQQQMAIREFLRTDNPAALSTNAAVRGYLPHFDFTVQLLRDPLMRGRLPPSLVPPLPLPRDAARSQDFEQTPDGGVSSGAGVSPAAQRFESVSIVEHRLPLLQFRVRGRLGAGGSELFVQDQQGRAHRPFGHVPRDTGADWRTLHLAMPPGPFRVVAVTPAGATGITFEPPIEVGWLTWGAPKVIDAWPLIGAAGLLLLAGGVVAERRRRR
jgi:hypothetical protein